MYQPNTWVTLAILASLVYIITMAIKTTKLSKQTIKIRGDNASLNRAIRFMRRPILQLKDNVGSPTLDRNCSLCKSCILLEKITCEVADHDFTGTSFTCVNEESRNYLGRLTHSISRGLHIDTRILIVCDKFKEVNDEDNN